MYTEGNNELSEVLGIIIDKAGDINEYNMRVFTHDDV